MKAIVLGSGADALVAARYLLKGGASVGVLEQHPEVDLPTIGAVPRWLARDIGLDGRFTLHESDPWISAPLPAGGRLDLWRDPKRSAAAIRSLSARDADRWPEFCERMARLSGVLERLYSVPAPDPMTTNLGELIGLLGVGLAVRRTGRRGITDLLRVLPMSVAELLDDWFENDTLKGVLGAGGVMHHRQGPRSGGTAFQLLHRTVGSPAGVFRPPRSDLARLLRGMGGLDIRSGAAVVRISVRSGRVTGVVLAGGEEIPADVVVSSVDPRRTLLDLTEPGWLDPDELRALSNIRYRGVAARVRLVLNQAPDFSTLTVAPSLDYLEKAYDAAKYGGVSDHPWLEANAEAPADGGHVVEVHVQFAPYVLAAGEWDDARREALGNRVVKLLSGHVRLGEVLDRTVLAPPDLERLRGWPEGQACHGELGLDQILFMRPVAGWSRYRTPIGGLFLCGPGTHPGGGLAGVSGALAAQAILKEAS